MAAFEGFPSFFFFFSMRFDMKLCCVREKIFCFYHPGKGARIYPDPGEHRSARKRPGPCETVGMVPGVLPNRAHRPAVSGQLCCYVLHGAGCISRGRAGSRACIGWAAAGASWAPVQSATAVFHVVREVLLVSVSATFISHLRKPAWEEEGFCAMNTGH